MTEYHVGIFDSQHKKLSHGILVRSEGDSNTREGLLQVARDLVSALEETNRQLANGDSNREQS